MAGEGTAHLLRPLRLARRDDPLAKRREPARNELALEGRIRRLGELEVEFDQLGGDGEDGRREFAAPASAVLDAVVEGCTQRRQPMHAEYGATHQSCRTRQGLSATKPSRFERTASERGHNLRNHG